MSFSVIYSHLKRFRVGIAGAGGLGSNYAVALKENIARVNQEVTGIIHQEKLDDHNIPEIFAGCDVIVEAFDSSDMKQMITETVQVKMPGIPIIIGSGIAGWGKSETIRCRKIDDTLYICGDESSEVSEKLPPMAPRVAMVGNMQANVVIEILMKIK
jgi:sulfur carrier protein ThiS adenylyltransferase